MSYEHVPVLVNEVVHYLQPKPGQRFIDGTLGGGGHTIALAQRLAPGGWILGIDLDPLAIATAKAATKPLRIKLTLAENNFKNLAAIAKQYHFEKANGILLDLGLSSGQLQDQKRGFSFLADGSLDMRFSPQLKQTAATILNTWQAEALATLFKDFGEERFAKPIAKRIIEARQAGPIDSPRQLLEIIVPLYQRQYRHRPSKINPATKVFQALRIAVNDELENLTQTLPAAIKLLAPGGRLAVISYHSLEDRIVKNYFRQESRDCICDPEMPKCQCGHRQTIRLVTHKPTIANEQETIQNHRSRSAKLRVIEKI